MTRVLGPFVLLLCLACATGPSEQGHFHGDFDFSEDGCGVEPFFEPNGWTGYSGSELPLQLHVRPETGIGLMCPVEGGETTCYLEGAFSSSPTAEAPFPGQLPYELSGWAEGTYGSGRLDGTLFVYGFCPRLHDNAVTPGTLGGAECLEEYGYGSGPICSSKARFSLSLRKPDPSGRTLEPHASCSDAIGEPQILTDAPVAMTIWSFAGEGIELVEHETGGTQRVVRTLLAADRDFTPAYYQEFPSGTVLEARRADDGSCLRRWTVAHPGGSFALGGKGGGS